MDQASTANESAPSEIPLITTPQDAQEVDLTNQRVEVMPHFPGCTQLVVGNMLESFSIMPMVFE